MNFYHSGEIGDIIYSLKAIKRIGGHLYLDLNLHIHYDPKMERVANPNKNFDVKHFYFIKDLIEKQKYIKSVQHKTPDIIHINLNDFRRDIFKYRDVNFADLFLKSCDLYVDEDDAYIPWIKCDQKFVKPISVIRVNRRTTDNFPWKVIADKYHSEMLFLGTKQEHEDFVNFVNHDVEHFDSSNLLEIAEVINGSSLFIGNCTSLTVCAEALKKNMIYENEHCSDHEWYHLHQFRRSNRYNVDPDNKNVELTMQKIEQFLNT